MSINVSYLTSFLPHEVCSREAFSPRRLTHSRLSRNLLQLIFVALNTISRLIQNIRVPSEPVTRIKHIFQLPQALQVMRAVHFFR